MESVWFATRPSSRTPVDTFVEGVHVDTVVAGAGLTGLATAVLLARAGQRVIVLEARSVGAVTTGNTTAKVSLLQGLTLSGIRTHHSEDVLRAYLEGNREGQAWLVRFMDDRGVPYQRRTAWTYAATEQGLQHLRHELDASVAAGLDVAWAEETELPFDVLGALTLPDQVQIDPLSVLDALLAEFAAHRGVLVEHTRVTDADASSTVAITTNRGAMTADRLVLATGTPILDRGAYFAKLTPLRSYATTYRVPAAPGSIIAVYAQTPSDSFVGVTLSVTFAAITSFLVASVILKASKKNDESADLAAATANMESMKGKKSSVSGVLTGIEHDEEVKEEQQEAAAARSKPIHKIVFACDAGMGSSAMGASVLRNKVKKAGFTDITVVNIAIANLTDDVDLIVTHEDLTPRARDKAPSAQHVSVGNFMNSPRYDEIVEELKITNAQGSGAQA